MRHVLAAAVLASLLGGCATGYATDWFRDEASIINPQLIRYGLDLEQSRCVGQALGERLNKTQLRRFQERAAAVRPNNADAVLTPANLRAVALGMEQSEIAGEFDGSLAACSVAAATVAAAAPATTTTPSTPASGTEGTPATSGGVPVDMTPLGTASGTAAAAGGRVTWLNLGSADSGQSIAIDAMSIEQAGAARTAWFRMTDPDTGQRTNNLYRLRIDCEARTVQPLALRQTDEAGTEVSMREYGPAEAQPGPAEAGTVLEIAFLSLCT